LIVIGQHGGSLHFQATCERSVEGHEFDTTPSLRSPPT
jgi:hypothetical protein